MRTTIYFIFLWSEIKDSLSTGEYFSSSPSVEFSIPQNPSERPYLFGFDMVSNAFDSTGQTFLISAPLGTEDVQIDLISTIRSTIGALYVCSYQTRNCQKKSAPSNLINSGNIMPMFGYKMIWDKRNNLIVSSPLADNILSPYAKIWKFPKDGTEISYILQPTIYPCSFGTDLYVLNNSTVLAVQETQDYACGMVHTYVPMSKTKFFRNYSGNAYGRLAVISDINIEEYLVIPSIAQPEIYPIINIMSLVTLTKFTAIVPIYGSNLSYSSFGFNIISEDVNRDGFKDIIVADHSYSSSLIDQGIVFVFLVRPSEKNIRDLISPKPSQVLFGPKQSYSYFGSSIASLGDLNKDNYKDIIVCAVGANENRGACYIFLGSSSGFDQNYIQEISAMKSESNDLESVRFFGSYVFTQFDVNSDLVEDILISSALSNKAFLLLGKVACEAIINLTPGRPIITLEYLPSCLSEYTCYKIILPYKLVCSSDPQSMFNSDPNLVITYRIMDAGGASQLYDNKNLVQNLTINTKLKVNGEYSLNILNLLVKNSVYEKRNFLTLTQSGTYLFQQQSCKSQCPTFQIMSDELKIYFDNDCADNSNCIPQLDVISSTNSSMLYAHANNTIYVNAIISNQGEFADEFNVTLTTFKNCTADFIIESTKSYSSLITKAESGIKEDNLTIYGIYNLKKNSIWNIWFVINAEVHDDKDLSVTVSVACPNCVKSAELSSKLMFMPQLMSDLKITGKANYAELSIPYQNDADPSTTCIQYSYYIEISSSGPSNVDNASITIELPSIMEERNITSFNIESDSATCSLKYPVCPTSSCAQLNATLACFITNLERQKIYNMSISVNLLHSYAMILHYLNSTRKLEIRAKVEHTNKKYLEVDKSQKEISIVVLTKSYTVLMAKGMPSWIVILLVLGCCLLILATVGLIYLIKSMSNIMGEHGKKVKT